MKELCSESEFETSVLRKDGFIHITGLPIGKDRRHRVIFPRKFWGKMAFDGLGVEIRLRENGEVWMKYGNIYNRKLHEGLAEKASHLLFDYDELFREPIFFRVAEFIEALHPSMIALRVADPYFDFQQAFPSDPAALE